MAHLTRKVLAAALVWIAAVMPACEQRKAPPAAEAPAEALKAPAPQSGQIRELSTLTADQPGRAATEAPLQAMLAARKLIRTGQLTVEVQDYAAAAEAVGRVAESHGGYLADSQSARDANDKRHGTLTLRVPAERFAQAFAALKQLGKVRSESIGTQDVTKAYTDLETRLRIKREAEARLRDILRTRTAKLSDVLEAERELARVTEEIEQMEGERRYYDQQVALSTITVSLAEPEPMLQGGLFEPIREAVRRSAEVLAASVATVIYAVVFLVPWLLIAALLWRVFRWLRARRQSKA